LASFVSLILVLIGHNGIFVREGRCVAFAVSSKLKRIRPFRHNHIDAGAILLRAPSLKTTSAACSVYTGFQNGIPA
jgi:hypothetical protein